MKKLIAAAFSAAFAASAIASDVLFWQVLPEGVSDAGIGQFDAVNIYVLTEGGEAVRIGGDEWPETQTAGSAGALPSGAMLAMTLPDVDLGGYGEGARFLAELSLYGEGAEDAVVGTTGEIAYGSIKPYLTTYAGGSTIPTQGVWNPVFSAVPEPTGGLLVLLGAAVLALRRRRA